MNINEVIKNKRTGRVLRQMRMPYAPKELISKFRFQNSTKNAPNTYF